MDGRDRALCTECFYGVLRWRLRLDAIIARTAPRGVPSDPELANVLRLGLYQLLVLDRVPERAAVHSTVSLARGLRGPRVAGFVNGLLRRVAREPPEPATLAERWGHPEWMVARFREELRDEAALEARLRANMAPPPMTVRLHPSTPPAEVPGTPSAHQPEVIRTDLGTSEVRQGVRDGRWLPQDEASARVVATLAPAAGERVLELCAERGVEASQIATAIGPTGRLVAVDASAPRLAECARLLARWAPEVRVALLAADATHRLPLRDDLRFDAVLVDAPCSGLGVIRRRPETLWRRRPEDVAALAAIQRKILAEAERWLAPGGRLVYAVCTTTPEETRDVVGDRAETVVETRPERDEGDGFFIARMTPP